MTKLDKYLRECEERVSKCANFPEATANLPFYVVMNKPRPSLSNSDSKEPTFWHPDDALFVLHARKDIPLLLSMLTEAKLTLEIVWAGHTESARKQVCMDTITRLNEMAETGKG